MGPQGKSDHHGTAAARTDRLSQANRRLRHINDILEEQSKRIAHAVHDEAGQLLAAVFVRLDQASKELEPACGTCFDEIKRMLEMIEVQLREIAHDLRPTVLDDLGLVPAIESFAERVARRHGIAVRCQSTISRRLPPSIETAAYRIVQEALNNVVKHARATRTEVQLAHVSGTLLCRVQDDGAGFDIDEVLSRKGARGLGLLGIRERVDSVGGTLNIHSIPGNGTTLSITIPLGE